MLEKLQEGSGVKAVLIVDGKPETFNLGIFARKGFGGLQREFGYINEIGTKYVKSIYSGGATGFGANAYSIQDVKEILNDDFHLITTYLPKIVEITENEAEAEKKRCEEHLKKQEEKVKAINNLPTTFTTGNDLLDKYVEFRRSEAHYNPRQSAQIQGGEISLYKKGDAIGTTNIHGRIEMEEYKTRDGKLQPRKFAKDLVYLTKNDQGVTNGLNFRGILQNLFIQKATIEQIVRNA